MTQTVENSSLSDYVMIICNYIMIMKTEVNLSDKFACRKFLGLFVLSARRER